MTSGTRDKRNWFEDRCKRCVFHGNEHDRELYGEDYCFRDYPRTTVREDCRIRLHKKAKWIDAFAPRSSLLADLGYLPVRPVQEGMSKEERRKRIKEYLGHYLEVRNTNE